MARASGLDVDVRRDHPFAAYTALQFHVPVFESGDVYARTMMPRGRSPRVGEPDQAGARCDARRADWPRRSARLPAFEPAFGIVEGWRGAIVHWVMADHEGKLFRVKVKDPSFANWPALSFALLKNIVPDFPLCNKSFNQSYSGNDL